MLRLRYVIIISLVLALSQTSTGGDLLDQALSSVGKTKADLGRAIPRISDSTTTESALIPIVAR